MSSAIPRREPPGNGWEIAGMVAGAAAAGLGLATWAGARLAAVISGGQVSGGLGEWLGTATRLIGDPADPADAWGDNASGLPGPLLYWLCTAVAFAVVGAAAAGAGWLWRGSSKQQIRRFGTATDAHVARRRDVRPLVVSSTIPPIGRLLLGRLAPSGPLLATEDAQRHPLRGRARRHQGDRGSVALVGPTRSGKTVLASAGIVGWDGPVVALSIKRDLYNATAAARAARGEVAVFDPSGVTGLASARWSPLRDVTTATAALRAARALAQAIPRIGVQSGDFWSKHGEAFMGAFMCLAGLSQLLPAADGDKPREHLTIELLASWAHMQIGIREPAVNELIRSGLAHDDLEVKLLARHAMTQLMALEREDPRIRASIYATARLAVEPWLEPAVAHSASDDPRPFYNSPTADRWGHRPRWVDLDWLMGQPDGGKANTLYLCAPDTEFTRLAPVLGGLLGDLREQIHAQDVRGQALSKPVLVVIDEAGQLELQWLPAAVSTLAGLGVILVTCWQSRTQITDLYSTLADAVLTGHRSKVFFSGLDDPSAVDYVTKMAGAEHIAQRGWSAEVRGGPRTVSEHLQREDLVPSHVVRQMQRQQAVLLHGTLPPIHLSTVRWWEDPQLRKLVPTNATGRPVPPEDLPTCPLSDQPAPPVRPALDPKTVQDPQAHLANPQPGADNDARDAGSIGAAPADSQRAPERRAAAASRAREPVAAASDSPPATAASASKTTHKRLRMPVAASGFRQLTFATDSQTVPVMEHDAAPIDGTDREDRVTDNLERNRVAGACDRCATWIKVGEGQVLHLGTRAILRCHPTCSL